MERMDKRKGKRRVCVSDTCRRKKSKMTSKTRIYNNNFVKESVKEILNVSTLQNCGFDCKRLIERERERERERDLYQHHVIFIVSTLNVSFINELPLHQPQLSSIMVGVNGGGDDNES